MFSKIFERQTASRLNNICRVGKVCEVIAENHAVKVAYADKDNIVSAALPVVALFAYGNKAYSLPQIGDTVLVLQLANDLSSGSGFVIGSLYTAENPPQGDENITRLEFADQAFIEYDRQNHNFKIQFNEKSYINFDGEHGELEIYCKGNIMINGDKRLEISTKDEIDIESNNDVNINGSNIRLN